MKMSILVNLYLVASICYAFFITYVSLKTGSRNREHPIGILIVSPFWPVLFSIALMEGGWAREMWSGKWKTH